MAGWAECSGAWITHFHDGRISDQTRFAGAFAELIRVSRQIFDYRTVVDSRPSREPSASACSSLRTPCAVMPSRSPRAFELMPNANRTVFAQPHRGVAWDRSLVNSQNWRSSSAKRVRSRRVFKVARDFQGKTTVGLLGGKKLATRYFLLVDGRLGGRHRRRKRGYPRLP